MRISRRSKLAIIGLCGLVGGLIFACGGSAEPVSPAATTAPVVVAATSAPVATAVPAATSAPVATSAPPAASATGPTGTLRVGVPELGPLQFVLYNQGFEQFKFDGIVTHEPMFRENPDGSVVGLLVESWDVDPAGLVYTLHLQEGAKWHTSNGDWGEFDADDFIGSIEQVTKEGSIHTASGNMRRIFLCDECTLEKIDSHTIKLTRPKPTVELTWHSRQPEGSAFALHSMKHFASVGEEAAGLQSVGTGPWELLEAKSGEFRKMKAVRDHWRQTPKWDEMWWIEIAEEATRLANFETGNLDTGSFNSDSIQAFKKKNLPNVKFMSFPGASAVYLNVLGQHYNPEDPSHHPKGDKPARIPVAEGTAYTARCKEVAFVSCDRDVTSAEWARARDVRLALAISIDRQKLVNNLAFGEGAPAYLAQWWGHDARAKQLGLDELKYEFDPARAKQLLADAGAAGLEIDFALPLRPGAAGAIVAGEAVAAMWQEIGVVSNLAKLPMSEYRGGFVRRSNLGINAHNGNPPIEPLRSYLTLYNSQNSLNFGFEHPDFQKVLLNAGSLTNDDERWEQLAVMARFIFDNVMSIPLYTENAVWPVGPNLGTWEPLPRVYAWLSNWEEAPHRK